MEINATLIPSNNNLRAINIVEDLIINEKGSPRKGDILREKELLWKLLAFFLLISMGNLALPA